MTTKRVDDWMPSRRSMVVVLAVCCLLPARAPTQSDTTTMTATTTVQGRAKIVSLTDLDFSTYDPTADTPDDAEGAVTVRATKGLTFTIYIGADRELTDGSGNVLDYELYTDSSRTAVWGSTSASGPNHVSASNVATSYPIYGRIPALQDLPAGSYSDTVVVTVEW